MGRAGGTITGAGGAGRQGGAGAGGGGRRGGGQEELGASTGTPEVPTRVLIQLYWTE